MVKVPPPEKRLCKIHGRPIIPSAWRNGSRTTTCAKCKNLLNYAPAARARRARRWETEFVACVRHPERRCNKALYARNKTRKCRTCRSLLASGEMRPGQIRMQENKRRRGNNRRTMQRYEFRHDPRTWIYKMIGA